MTRSDRFRDSLFMLIFGYGVQFAATGRWTPVELLFIAFLALCWAWKDW